MGGRSGAGNHPGANVFCCTQRLRQLHAASMRRVEGCWGGDAPFADGLDGRDPRSGPTFGQVDVSMPCLAGRESSKHARMVIPTRDGSAACNADHTLVHGTIEVFREYCPGLHRAITVQFQSAPLFEAIDTALNHIATGTDCAVEGQRTTWSDRPMCPLILSFGNRVCDLARSEQAPAARVAIAFVSDESLGPGSRPSASTRARDTNADEHRLQLCAVMAMPGRDYDRKRSPFPGAGQMELGGQPSPATPKPFISRVLDPLFTSAWLGRRRAPLACW
jgi:hypothetical protein